MMNKQATCLSFRYSPIVRQDQLNEGDDLNFINRDLLCLFRSEQRL